MPWGPYSTAAATAAATMGVASRLPDELGEVKHAFLIAGFLGGGIAISLQARPTWRTSAAAIVAGLGAGWFLAPALQEVAALTERAGFGLALCLGICAQPLFGGIHAIATAFRHDPAGTLERAAAWWRTLRGRG